MSLKRKRLASVIALTLTAVLSAQTSFAYSNVTLKAGMRGSDVYSLQRDLNELGFMTVKPTGYYGTITKAAVLDMQKQYGLLKDGIAGRKTLGKLDSLMEAKAAEVATAETEAVETNTTVTEAAEAAETTDTEKAEVKAAATDLKEETAVAKVAETEATETKAAEAETLETEEKPAEVRTPARTSRGDLRSAVSIIDYAKRFIGVDYVWGGTTPKGFDCSGFIKYVYGHFDVALSRNSTAQASNGTYIKKADLLPGDLVFFDTNGGRNRINHVGIYIGNGNMIQSSSSHNGVVISNIESGFYSKTYMTARRVLD